MYMYVTESLDEYQFACRPHMSAEDTALTLLNGILSTWRKRDVRRFYIFQVLLIPLNRIFWPENL